MKMIRMVPIFLSGIILLLAGYWVGFRQGKQQRTMLAEPRVVSAVDEFALRSQCASLGRKILEGNVIGPALTQRQVSHYDPDSNRCYVELDVQTADLNLPQEQSTRARYLYDGQTTQFLAYATVKGERRAADVFFDGWTELARKLGMADPSAYPADKGNPKMDFDVVQTFIEKVMQENRGRSLKRDR